MLGRLKKSLTKNLAAIVSTAAIGIGSLFLSGCDQYNRADISQDGTKIAFSLNKEGGFETNSTSEMYIVSISGPNLSDFNMERLTIDNRCDSWASFSPDGESLLYVKGTPNDGDLPMGIYLHNTPNPSEQGIKISEYFSSWYNFPLQVPDKTIPGIFYAYFAPNYKTQRGGEIVCQFTSGGELSETGPASQLVLRLEELVRIPWNDEEGPTLWSTTPAFAGGNMYYAVAKQTEEIIDAESGNTSPANIFNVTLYSVNLSTKQQRQVAEFNFSANGPEMPVGMADLAVSPDNKRMIACFLPAEGFNIPDSFDDQQPSLVYSVDLENGRVEGGEKVYMYNPQFKPIFEKEETEPTTQPASQPASLEEKVSHEFLFLSGAGYTEKDEQGEIKGGRSVYLATEKNPEGERELIELARLPDKIMTAYTGWVWLSEDRIRIYQIGESGLIVIDTNKDGTNQERRYLDREHLNLLKRAADLESGLDLFKEQYEFILNQFSITQKPAEAKETPTLSFIDYLKRQVEEAKAAANGITFIEGLHPSTSIPTSQPFYPEQQETIETQPAILPKEED